jgi:type IV pilus assembly protein PilA
MLARIRKVQEENEGGFTLIELLVVMIIIGILAAIAIPAFLSQRNKGEESSMKSDLRALATEVQTALVDSPADVAIGGGAQAGADVVFSVKATASATAVDNKVNLSPNNKLNSGTVDEAAGTYCISLNNVKSKTDYKVSVAATGATQKIESGTCGGAAPAPTTP